MINKLTTMVNETSPKQLGGAIKRDPDLLSWLIESTDSLIGNPTLSERAYAAINGVHTNVCHKSGVNRRFKSVVEGYGFCGKANACECARESVSQNVRIAKALVNDTDKQSASAKRASTNLARYGVTNIGQLDKAKVGHKRFYSDKQLIQQQVQRQKSTMLDRYGVDNAAHINGMSERKKKTNLARYGVENISQLASSRDRTSRISSKTWKRRKESNVDFHRLNDKFKNNCHVRFDITPEEYKGSVGNIWYRFKCNHCNSTFNTWISCGHLPICKVCHPTRHVYKSGEETEVFDYLRSLDINVTQRNRSIIYPMELDIIDQDKKIAIEYCGLYWHSEISNHKVKDYHINKMKRCHDAGYRLITIFSDEWNQKKDIVKNKLKSIFAKNQISIGARSCVIDRISSKDAARFYENNHLQGAAKSSIHLGLFFHNDLVAAMSFGKNRAFISSNGGCDQHELIRYATNTHVQGGAGKLLNHYIKTVNPSSIISYADARWSNGKMYEALGFIPENINNLNPGYWYTKDYSSREHRFNYTKSSLIKRGFDHNLTEWEIMQSLGFDRIWDCGQLKFKKHLL